MKKEIIISLSVVALAAISWTVLSRKDSGAVKIGVCKVMEIEALNSVVSGMSDYLKRQNKNYKISVETSQCNMALGAQIIARFVGSGYDIIVTVGTTPTQSAFKLAKEGRIKNLVFSSVTNPGDISEKLSGNNTTGVSNFVDLEPQIEVFRRIQPSLKRLGIIYNTGESLSVFIIKQLKQICEKNGLELVEQGVSKISDVYQAAKKLSKAADAIFIANDNLILSAIPGIVSICNQNKIPVYVSDTDEVEKGCLAALGPSEYEVGVQTGEIVQRICDGEDINNIEVSYPKKMELYLNLKAAKILGLEIPADIRAQANKIIEK